MPEQMIFRSMIEDNGVPFTADGAVTEGYYQDGDWIDGQIEKIPMFGIVLPVSNDELRYAEAGTYSTKDRKVLTVQPLEEGKKIHYKGISYTVQSFKDLTDYADVFIYVARWAGNENSTP
jgi:hypothetical protein